MAAIRKFLEKYWLVLFLAISVSYIVFYIVDQLGRIDGSIRLSPLALVVTALFQVAFWLLSSHLWRTILFAVSAKAVTLKESFLQLCLVNLGKYVPGKVWGMVARASYSQQKHGIDIDRNIQATYIEQVYLLGSGAILAALIVAALASNPLLLLAAIIVAVAILIATVYQRPLTSLLRLLHKLRKREGAVQTIEFRISARFMLGMLLQYMFVWVLLGLVMYGLYLSLFPAGISFKMAAVITLSCVVGVSAGFLAVFAPAGIGVREAVSAFILAEYMQPADSLLLVLVFRLWLGILELTMGGAFYFWKHRSDG